MNPGEFELVILFTKAMQLDSMLLRIKPLLPAAKVVMILSNGLEILKRWRNMSIGRKSMRV